ncbi:serine/threonine-protein kinase [Myxococcus sp. RHSTA-1-4]|uniref:serine/threonine-protein kinase n=1 Tax=Myxococcus sp. RHSTA-1-4 TaxID=2874601 RepID=UPI001CC07DA1|nr:serine/threonine-protein kinase [Myxococcus sp. RHSTA-1-4]MBZ4416904.1 protein kinase [Myxococcus sp. RHSTA-1-4]
MNFLCPACRTPLPGARVDLVVPCSACGVQVDLARVETAPGVARFSPEVDLTGESLGGFRLVGRLGAGGMGTVYAAEGHAGPCAVKVLSTLVAADPAVRVRFRREAEALRQVQHPAIVRVLAEGEERGFCWYAMERVDGPDLRAKLTKDGPLPWPEVEGLARRMLEALGAAHEHGFIHRDVKPGNILLAPDGAKLCDFGIARLDGATTLTESAALIGSLRYMAPEQQRLGRAVAQSDLFALGLVLYEALAGGFPGEKPLPAGVPGRLRRLLTRLLAERIEDRPDSAESARRLLERRVPVGALAVGTSTVAALAALLLLGPAAASREPPAATKAPVPQAAQAVTPAPEPSPVEPLQTKNTEPSTPQAPRVATPGAPQTADSLGTRGTSPATEEAFKRGGMKRTAPSKAGRPGLTKATPKEALLEKE